MQNTFLIILSALLFNWSGYSQSCLPDGIYFATQAEIANFPNNYPGCTVIEGSVNISGANINNLNGLAAITAIRGSLFIGGNPLLTNVNGLGNLVTVGGEARIFYNDKLPNLNGMSKLNSIAGDFMIDHNPAMTSLGGLNGLTTVGRDFTISTNYSLVNMEGLNSLDSVGRYFSISENKLQSLQGLSSLRSLPGTLAIGNNYTLNRLSGLDSLVSVGTNLNISKNPGLKTLEGLGSLAYAGGLNISSNDSLENLDGLNKQFTTEGIVGVQFNAALKSLQGLEHLKKVRWLLINDNPSLTSLSSLDSVMTVDETLQIYKNNAMTTLDGLKSLKSVGTIFLLEGNHALTKLNGLNSLDSIGGFFSFTGNEVLTDFDELKNLRVINGSLYFSGSNLLKNLNGFEKLQTVGYDFDFYAPSLTNFQGLKNLRRVGQRFSIYQNPALKNLEGLDHLQVVGGNFQISANPVLRDLTGLDSLNTIGGEFYVVQNPVLKSLEGPDNLKQVVGQLRILQNPKLSECATGWLCNLLILGAVNPQITDNDPGCDNIRLECAGIPIRAAVLTDADGDCVVDSSAKALSGIQVVLTGNLQQRQRETHADGVARFGYSDFWKYHLSLPQFPAKNWAVCQDTIFFDQPTSLDTIRATFLLQPLNQCPELSVDLGLPSNFRGCFAQSPVQVSIQNVGTVVAEDAVGVVVMPPVFEWVNTAPLVTVQHGDTLFFNLGDLKPFEMATIRLTVKTRCDTFLFNQTLCWESFANMANPCPSSTPPGSEVIISAKCLGDTTVQFTLKNIGEKPTQGLHEYRILRNTEVFSTGNFSLDPQQSQTIDLKADGATWRMEATKTDEGAQTARSIERCGGLTPGMVTAFWMDKRRLGYDFDCREVVGAFDPNQKTAIPAGAGAANLLEADRPIRYTIDFQNTGTDTAFRVLLRDVLPEKLDVATFRPGAASHPYTWEIRQQHILEVLFFPIMLPDSNVNEPASHGFFSFTIDQLPHLPDGTALENKASIIFDFNPPIVTNTVVHHIGQLTVQATEPQRSPGLWEVLGNPTRTTATFRAKELIVGEKCFELHDAAGRLIRLVKFTEQSFEFQRETLPAGVYFFRIGDEQGRVWSGKIVVVD